MKGRGFFKTAKLLCTLLGIAMILGCKEIEYVPVESYSVEHHYHTDTVKQVDSVLTEKETVIREADSAMVANLGLKLKDNERAILILRKELQKAISQKSESKSDTVIKVDSIRVPYPVERKLTKWEQIKMNAGGISIGLCVFCVLLILIGFIVRAYRKT